MRLVVPSQAVERGRARGQPSGASSALGVFQLEGAAEGEADPTSESRPDGLNENRRYDERYRDAYAACMRGRGYTG